MGRQGLANEGFVLDLADEPSEWDSGEVRTPSLPPPNNHHASSETAPSGYSGEQLTLDLFSSPPNNQTPHPPAHRPHHPANTATPPSQNSPPTEEWLNSLFTEVYQELRGIARGMLRTSPPNRTLQPTVLVHEVYLRLCHTYHETAENRRHFFGAAAESMRRILIEDARRRMTLRRGGNWARIPLDQLQLASDANPETLVGLDEALEKLSQVYPLEAKVVRLIFYGGLTAAEAAETLNLCDRTIKRHWAFARAWLYKELAEST